jgi:hypothetical protein
MENILNITNGDCALDIMRQAGIAGDILPWRDVLHDGPVPANLTLDELSQIRAQFIIQRGWGDARQITDSFIQRDNTLKAIADYERVVLWFEHDLYDQLQLLQILDWLHFNNPQNIPLSMICEEQYLGMLSADQMLELLAYEKPLSAPQLELASSAWSAFRAPTPLRWKALLDTDTTALPFLQHAIRRMLQEYPSCFNGLSRVAQQTLAILSQGPCRARELFSAYQQTEHARFLGDSSFWVLLNELLATPLPLIELDEGQQLNTAAQHNPRVSITGEGNAVLAGESNWLQSGTIERWIGGVHLTAQNLWCWDDSARRIIRKT